SVSWFVIERLEQLVESCQSAEHGRLAPMQGGSFVNHPFRIPAIVEIARRILHIFDRPSGDFQGQVQTLRIAVMKKYQRVDGLRGTLNVERKRLAIVVTRCPVIQEKSPLPVVVTGL